jgi:hypothetical protein
LTTIIIPPRSIICTPCLSTAQVIDPGGKAKFDLVYNGVINKTSSYLLPVNISIYPRIDSGEPNRVIYADAPTNTTTSILLLLTPLQQSGFWDWNLLIRELVAGTPPAIIAAVVSVVATISLQAWIKKRENHIK